MFACLLALAVLLRVGESAPSDIVAQPREFTAVRTTERMHIDGHPDEAVWQRTAAQDAFTTRVPHLGETPPSRTTLRVAYDELALYVLVEVEMPPDDVVMRTLRRDTFALYSDDAISVKIDPRYDRRTAVIFSTNAAGTQLDMLSLDNGRVGLPQWDAVWEVEVWRHDRGFTAEFRLPFSILGVDGNASGAIGFNISRDHSVENATYDWRLIVPPRSPMSASSFGLVTGIQGIETGRALQLTPYVAGRTDFTRKFTVDPRKTPNLSAGGDVRLQVGTSSYVEASVLTDFAQVEADQVQVARDRFPLFFPERRPFFINGLDAFNFGREGEAQLFFSRRVGLQDGRAVPVAAGAKAYGRTARISYGVLNVQTLRAIEEPTTDDETREADIPPENFSVGRVRYRPFPALAVGVIALGKHRFGDANEDAFSAGADADLTALDGKLRWYSFVGQTHDREPVRTQPSENLAVVGSRADTKIGRTASSSFEYEGLYVRPSVSVLWSDRQFRAPLGFYSRPGTASHNAQFLVAPRPRALGLQELVFGPFGNLVMSPGYQESLTSEAGGSFEARWRSAWAGGYTVSYKDDRVDRAFELYGFDIAAGRYEGDNHRFWIGTPDRYAVNSEVSYEYGQLFAGRAHQANATVTARMGKHVSIDASYSHLWGHVTAPEDRFGFGYANGTINLALNRNVAWDTALRLNLQPNVETFAVQSRLRWRYHPGSDLYLVYTTSQPLGEADPDPLQTREPFHAITLKATYYFEAMLGR